MRIVMCIYVNWTSSTVGLSSTKAWYPTDLVRLQARLHRPTAAWRGSSGLGLRGKNGIQYCIKLYCKILYYIMYLYTYVYMYIHIYYI